MKIKGIRRKQSIRTYALILLILSAMCSGSKINAQEKNHISSEKYCDSILEAMTLEEKVAQMFFITPEALTGVNPVTAAGAVSEECFQKYPVGGLVYFRENIESRVQLSSMLNEMGKISKERIGVPLFLATDEEGGSVTRVYGSNVDGIPDIGDMFSIGTSGDLGRAYQAGLQIGSYLYDLNFNVDFAPVADIYSNPLNTVIGKRAFGTNAEDVSGMVSEMVKGMKDSGIKATLKHFPGHGDTAEDSHNGYACSYKTLDELRVCELIPFRAGIEAGADFVMMGHISLPNILGDYTPATLSYTIVSELLREELEFDGIVITDALNMGAISNHYSSAQAVLGGINAGIDMFLMPYEFQSAYEEVVNAVHEGRITEERINESAKRIIQVKLQIE